MGNVDARDMFDPYLISWNVTERCNLRCAHCYLDASYRKKGRDELTTAAGFLLIDEIAETIPRAILILSGGEPLLRKDIYELAKHATQRDLMVVVGTNGILLDKTVAGALVNSGVRGIGISLDSLDPKRHDAFRGVVGAWEKTVLGIETCRDVSLEFQIQTTVTRSNYDEIPEMMEYAHAMGAKAFNLFFLVCTGRGQGLSDITPEQYEKMLTHLAKAQGTYGNMMVRARCAPHFMRVLHEEHGDSLHIRGYFSRCLAGKQYCRITPQGDVTPCPYLPIGVGNVREYGFDALWNSKTFKELRTPKLEGKCGVCKFGELCGGCRARAYATRGNYLAADPWCSYRPLAGEEKMTLKTPSESEVIWSDEARKRIEKAPLFVRKHVMREIERRAREKGYEEITVTFLDEVKPKGSNRIKFTKPEMRG